jgi:Asp-tRNA(Asn)/Glu-tRNA(Gln) amidotransferase A subunit family amidase
MDQARLVQSRQISPVELTRAYLSRIERYDPTLHAYISVLADRALEQARVAEIEIGKGRYRGLLHGIPYGVKDQFFTRGIKTTLGSKILSDFVPDHDAAVIERLDAAGAILIGKHNLHEFGKGGTIDFPFGQPRNPWDISRTPASSSTGSGIALAAGLCTVALGNDTGGSIRWPAAANGIVGLRPTYGRVSRFGALMFGWNADTIGPMGRCVADCAATLQVIAGHDPRDPMSSTSEVPDYVDALAATDLTGFRIGLIKEMTWVEGMHPAVINAMEESVRVLRSLGAKVEEMSLKLVKHSVPLQMMTTDADVAAVFLRKWLRTDWDKFDRGTRSRLAAACLVPAPVYNRAMRARNLVRQEMIDAMNKYDALITATHLHPAPSIEKSKESVKSAEDMMERVLKRRISTWPFSGANVPAIALPNGFSGDPLPMPVSLQIAAKPFAEQIVFRIAHAFEQVTPWHKMHPELDRTAILQEA